MTFKKAPQVFHAKEEKPKNFIVLPYDLFVAINNTCTNTEAKILMTLLGCKGDGSFAPSTQYMLKTTGISKPNHYFEARRHLMDKGLIEADEEGNLYIDVEKILATQPKQGVGDGS